MTSVRTLEFKTLYLALPVRVRSLADSKYQLWSENTKYRGVNFECVDTDHDIWSVRIGDHHRALCKKRGTSAGPRYVWFWIGTHEEYNGLI